MPVNNFQVRWESFSANISNGFANLQQMQEFVDVTLAAGEYMIGAHQNVLALASPYFWEMLKSNPCKHPVIFLGPINHTVLAFILEYIYTGEVNIPSSILPSFVNAAKLLHIKGIKDLTIPKNIIANVTGISRSENEPCDKNTRILNFQKTTPFNIDITPFEEQPNSSKEKTSPQLIDFNNGMGENENIDYLDDDNLNDRTGSEISRIIIDNVVEEPPPQAIINSIGDDNNDLQHDLSVTTQDQMCQMDTDPEHSPGLTVEIIIPQLDKSLDVNNQGSIVNNSPINSGSILKAEEFNVDTPSGVLMIKPIPNTSEDITKKNNTDKTLFGGNIVNPVYTKSIRGNLHMILNRYLYNLVFTSYQGRKRRWRCVDYRRNHCRAYVDTFDEEINARTCIHKHDFHDKKILKLTRKKQLYTSIEQANS